MLEGITAGFIVSLLLYPGTVWLAKIGVSGRVAQVIAVGFAFWLSSSFWLFIAAPGLMMMYANLSFIQFGMHLFAAMVLIYIGIKYFRTRKVERIDDATELPSAGALFKTAFIQSLAMPMRLPAAMAVLLATGVYINHPPAAASLPPILLGIVIGLTWWWGQFTGLALFFAKRVPQGVTVRSLNKIRPFCAVLCLALAMVVLFLAV
jgi:threonine/homoserine/homoserine lactone efflux protein